VLPWPRAAYGRLCDALFQAGAAAVAINVVFEGASAQGPADDAALVESLKRHQGRIALAAEWLEPHDSQGAGGLVLVRPEGLQAAVPATLPLGVTNILPPQPGQPLRHPEAYRAVLASQGIDSPPSLAGRVLQLAGRRSRQPDGRRELHIHGPEGHLRRIPAWEVLDPRRWSRQPLRPAVRGALVLVGPVVSQGEAGHSSPFGTLSGLEVLGTAVANSLEGDGLALWPLAPWARALLAAGTVALAALLALIGYSNNDTIIVFDRVRETLHLHPKMSIEDAVNKSINETLGRTILTSLTTFLSVLALWFLGGKVIEDFAFTMLVGIVVGTYSSVFIASNLVIFMTHYYQKRDAKLAAQGGKKVGGAVRARA